MTTELSHSAMPQMRATQLDGAERVANRVAASQSTGFNTGWEEILVPLGLAKLASAIGNEQYLLWVKNWLATHLQAGVAEVEATHSPLAAGDGSHGLTLGGYCGDWGWPFVVASLPSDHQTPELMESIVRVSNHILSAPLRSSDGTILHSATQPEVWVDSMYYTISPLAHAATVTDDCRYLNEAVRQAQLHSAHLQDTSSGCFFHEADPRSGRRSNWLWSRGNGWAIMSLADLLLVLEPDSAAYREIAQTYRNLVVGLLRLQHPCGLWRIVPEDSESHLETSGSAMIATGIALGVRAGILDASEAASVRRTWNELLEWINPDGTVAGCQTPAGVGGWETHKRSNLSPRTYGDGVFLRLSAEIREAGII